MHLSTTLGTGYRYFHFHVMCWNDLIKATSRNDKLFIVFLRTNHHETTIARIIDKISIGKYTMKYGTGLDILRQAHQHF